MPPKSSSRSSSGPSSKGADTSSGAKAFDPFASIRVAPKKARAKAKEDAKAPVCDKPGCEKPGGHKAPKGRDAENSYWNFCIDHVREYNKTYNYFSGMEADEVAEFAKKAETGHRPTWKMGGNAHAQDWERENRAKLNRAGRAKDPFEFAEGAAPRPEKRVRRAEQKALDTLGLDAGASKDDMTARFKTLMARYHPDLNGGDNSDQDRLRDIIQAYKLLKG